MPLPAFSNFPLQGSNARIIWSSLFNGTIALATPTSGDSLTYTGNVTGADSNSHGVNTLDDAWQIAGGQAFYAQYLLDAAGALSTRFVTTSRPSTFVGGIGNEIEIKQVARSATEWSGSLPQCEFVMELSNTYFDTSPVNEYYCSKMIRIPSNMIDVLDRPAGVEWTVAWSVIEDVKCGPVATNDARIIINVLKVQGETGLRFRAALDNCGTDTLTGVNNGIIAGLNSDGVIDYGQTDESTAVPGKDYKIEYWIKRSAGREDLTTGRFVAIATRMDTGERFTIINKTGGQFWGYHSHHFKRFFPIIVYTGGFPSSGDYTMVYSNIEYWSFSPYIII